MGQRRFGFLQWLFAIFYPNRHLLSHFYSPFCFSYLSLSLKPEQPSPSLSLSTLSNLSLSLYRLHSLSLFLSQLWQRGKFLSISLMSIWLIFIPFFCSAFVFFLFFFGFWVKVCGRGEGFFVGFSSVFSSVGFGNEVSS